VFGFTDDPVIGQTSKVTGVSAYVPGKGPYRIDDKFLPLPLGGFAYRPEGSNYVFANAAYAWLAGGLKRSPNDLAGGFAGEEVIIERITFLSPSFAVEISDNLSFGMSVGVNYSALYIKQNFRAANELLGLARFAAEEICPAIQGTNGIPFIPPDCLGDNPLGPFDKIATVEIEATDPMSLSYNMGVLWDVNPRFTLGLAYQSPMKANLRGEFKFDYDDSLVSTIAALNGDPFISIIMQVLGLPTNVPPSEVGDLRIDLEYPDHVALGTKYLLTDRLQMNIDWHWTDWEQWNTINVILNRSTVVTQLGQFVGLSTVDRLGLNLGLENQANFGIGFKYHWSSRIIFKWGMEDRRSSVPDNKRSAQLPFGDTLLYGAGITYKFTENMTLDFSLVHFTSTEFIPAGTSSNANSESIDNALSPYAGLDVTIEQKATLAGFTIKALF
jgi:long-subunit fatty acid transport protein